MSPSTSGPPAGLPKSGGNTKYAVVAVVLLLGIAGIIALRSSGRRETPVAPPAVSVVVSPPPPANPKLDDIPPPPPPDESPDTGPVTTRIVSAPNAGCDGKCAGSSPPELAQALQIRGIQARRCYNTALAQDSTLRGHVSIAVRIGPSGNVCSATVASNDMRSSSVANCAANIFRSSGAYPSPRGGCIDANVPLSFVPNGP